MRVIIAGSRTITDKKELEKALEACGFKNQITEVVCGDAFGVDRLGRNWAEENKIPVKYFIPDWNLLGKAAGPMRNSQMATYAAPNGALLAVWDGISSGTSDMIKKARRFGLQVYIHLVEKKKRPNDEPYDGDPNPHNV